MMRYDEGELTDNRPCAGIRADLKMCLLESDCCKIVSKLCPTKSTQYIFYKYSHFVMDINYNF